MTLPTTFKEWMERYTSDPDFRRHIDERNEVSPTRKAPKVSKPRKAPKPACVLNDHWLLQCISRLQTQGESEEALLDCAYQWEKAALRYLQWLQLEGFTKQQSLAIIATALKKADFDLGKFPVCS